MPVARPIALSFATVVAPFDLPSGVKTLAFVAHVHISNASVRASSQGTDGDTRVSLILQFNADCYCEGSAPGMISMKPGDPRSPLTDRFFDMAGTMYTTDGSDLPLQVSLDLHATTTAQGGLLGGEWHGQLDVEMLSIDLSY